MLYDEWKKNQQIKTSVRLSTLVFHGSRVVKLAPRKQRRSTGGGGSSRVCTRLPSTYEIVPCTCFRFTRQNVVRCPTAASLFTPLFFLHQDYVAGDLPKTGRVSGFDLLLPSYKFIGFLSLSLSLSPVFVLVRLPLLLLSYATKINFSVFPYASQ